MQATLTLNDDEYAVLHAMLKGEREEAHHMIHQSGWKHHDDLKARLAVVEGLLKKMEGATKK